MINLSSTVCTWYHQRKAPRLFAESLAKQRQISIHEIVNLNKGVTSPLQKHPIGNTLALLCLVRKRKRLTVDYLEGLGQPHSVQAIRLVRAWKRSQNR